ncbi:bifunctional enoyl-CoA hydratase/phosphate acetyltransferase [Alteromonas lipolytica]|uniref:Enoyl-CoA hydratase n=1 Tax=Alteromonas lipolytica TaxID=1856405 RepID=A0A1E8F8Y5_9ALTE|nr:bifunctional enoyl-CoA hydratase/phosphate acetyltransferase [Alteromonas lipolytica]OFI32236.1 enoyl-CoA hydratase [Alteromonas lipolytica]GGF82744.1 phosphate acetyltransferase [Alteromonas lipolytica]
MEMIRNKPYDSITVGDTASLSRTLTRKDIQLFAIMSGDVNPAHVDEEYANSSQFHHIIAHGMWGGALISTVLGTQLPGPGTIYLKQDFTFRRPVSLGDNLTVSVTVLEKRDHHHILLDCSCTNQDNEVVIEGQALVKAPTEQIDRPRAVLPAVELKEESVGRYQQFMDMAKGMSPLKTCVIHPVDLNSLAGAVDAAEDNLIEPILVGPRARIEQVAKENKLDISRFELVDTPHSHAAAETAVKLVSSGQAEALMKGHLHTDEMMHEVLNKEYGLRTGRGISHIFALDAPSYHKSLFLTDAAINIRPNLATKKDIIQNAIELVYTLTNRTPKVAILSAVETVEEKIPSTLDATALCKMAERGQIVGGLLDGPLAMDNAISADAAKAKAIMSQVAGDADILVAPDLESGNMLFKQMRYLSGIEGAGIVLGARAPIILTSRAGGPLTRKVSCAMALVYQRKRAEQSL